MDGRFISYLRVSTAEQGASGLGIEAQRAAVLAYLNGGSWTLLAELTETESGKNSGRPELAKALAQCKLTGATLLIAKLDRLSRNVAFISALMEQGVPFVACDMPHATPFELHIRASVAEEEARMISKRTKSALAAAKARGTKLGGWRPRAEKPDTTEATKALQQAADGFARSVAPIVREMREQGCSLAQIAVKLTSDGIRTSRGGAWTPTAVRNVLARAV
jgi:DNA invertase Pin-like site-specific DNA recombinase